MSAGGLLVAERIRDSFETAWRDRRRVPEEVLQEALGVSDVEAFWGDVDKRITARRLRLVFLADAIPSELCRIIEFLNEQLRNTEVLGIEIPPQACMGVPMAPASIGLFLDGPCEDGSEASPSTRIPRAEVEDYPTFLQQLEGLAYAGSRAVQSPAACYRAGVDDTLLRRASVRSKSQDPELDAAARLAQPSLSASGDLLKIGYQRP